MPSPLNPMLYSRLREEFGRVQVAHEGIAASHHYAPDIFDGQIKMHMTSAGEYYRINCPFCGDSRGRLWINHLWGVPDEVTGKKNLWLSICYNEDCLSVIGRPGELWDRVYGFKNAALRGKTIVILPGEVETQVLRAVPLPGVTLRLDRISEMDPVIQYVRRRGLDPIDLAQTFDVSYCLDANYNYPMAHGRIVIPIHMNKMLVGWQCRYVGDIDWKTRGIPKYYNLPNMPRRLMLYNFDVAVKQPFVVVTEGPLDAWSVGEPAVATFGKHLSAPQVQLICQNWEHGAVVILLDGDAWEDAQLLADRFRQAEFKGAVVPVQLPPDSDPGGLARSFLWEHIDAACQRAGVDLLTIRRDDTNDRTHEPRHHYRAPRSDDAVGRDLDIKGELSSYSFDRPADAVAGA